MNTPGRTEGHQTRPRTQKAFRSTELLVGGHLAISVLTLVGVILLRNHATVVNSAVWTHGTIVAASALLLLRRDRPRRIPVGARHIQEARVTSRAMDFRGL